MNKILYNKRFLSAAFLAVVIFMLLFLALQPLKDNSQLGLWAWRWLKQMGVNISLPVLRTVIHIPEYFMIGTAVFLYGRVRDWNLWKLLLVAIGIGVAEETFKYFLPLRDFDWPDIGMDAIGVCLAVWEGHVTERWLKRE